MQIEDKIRELARSNYWQNLYHSSKEINGINLFQNDRDFSGLQNLFLYWLRVYHMLFEELGQKDWENLNESVLKDDICCDAFLYWRSKEQEKRIYENQKQERENKSESKKNSFKIFRGVKN